MKNVIMKNAIIKNVIMKHLIRKPLKWALTGLFPLAALCPLQAANTVETVEQVQGTVTLATDVDYTVTSANPFADDAIVNITNTDRAVLILTKVIPSKVPALFSHIQINGEKATKDNCMVKIYANGSIILPHPASISPLTVYSENDLAGDSESYAVGERLSLKGTAMDNRICSFTLKRGYMAWFAQKADGTGYNRLWIADKEDITVNLPGALRRAISSLRVSKWNDASKKGYAGYDPIANGMLNTTWCYNWDAGINIWDDREYVTHHHHEGWPGITDVGNNGTSANILGNNEPDNTADDREQVNSVADVLKTWPQMMATGRRLGSPAVSGNYNWLYEFIDSIDARGWRCDFIAVHAYWYSDWSSWKSKLNEIHNRTRRPIWITEMNYGANWTGWPGSDTGYGTANENILADHLNPIIDGLEATPWLERYAIYNWVQDCRKVYDNDHGRLTKAGEYYANMESGLAYDSRYEVAPNVKQVMKDPTGLFVFYDKSQGTARLEWKDYNGEYNYAIYVERKVEGQPFTIVAEVAPQEEGSDYSFIDTDGPSGSIYRIHIIDGRDKDRYSNQVMAISLDTHVGDPVTINGETRYLGGNLFVNGDFDMGTTGWTNGVGEALSLPDYYVVPLGSVDDGAYLQMRSHGGKNDAASIKTVVDVVPGADYYFMCSGRNQKSAFHNLAFSKTGEEADSLVATVIPGQVWTSNDFTIHNGSFAKALFNCYYTNASSQVDKVTLCRAFATPEEAYADGMVQLKKRAEAARQYLAGEEELVTAIDAALAAATGQDAAACEQLQATVDAALKLYVLKDEVISNGLLADEVLAMQMEGYEALQEALDRLQDMDDLAEALAAYQEFKSLLDNYLVYERTDAAIAAPTFNNVMQGWTVKCGTYTGGSQKIDNLGGKTCWAAKWTGIAASEGDGKTMEIKQTTSALTHGMYALECKAATEFLCLSDQHGYMTVGDSTLNTPTLSAHYLDLPTVDNQSKWQTLVTEPIYVDEGTKVTIGFVGSKENATDNLWREFGVKDAAGDQREGWWAATDFALRYTPVYRRLITEGEWGTICLPFAYAASSNVQLYQLVGITADYQHLCLQEVSMAEAGEPLIYRMTGNEAWFHESGEAVKSATTTDYQLRGNFKTSLSAKAGFYVLQNGEWIRVGSGSRPKLTSFGAALTTATALPVFESWSGETMKITGADEEIIAAGIQSVEADGQQDDTYYNMGGLRIQKPRQQGVYIRDGQKLYRK